VVERGAFFSSARNLRKRHDSKAWFVAAAIHDYECSRPIWPGKLLNHCQVSEKLGAGGMGAVYRAKDQKFGPDVAIKVPPEDPEHRPLFFVLQPINRSGFSGHCELPDWNRSLDSSL